MIIPILVSALLTQLSPDAPAPRPAGQFARMVVIQPKPGRAAEFKAGYARHLDWHRTNRDPWTWYGWTFVLGERIGQFMDGTFGHAIADFDHAIDPAADSADNDVNVVPHADFASHGVYERVADASVGEPLPDASPFLALATWFVVPGQEGAFESAIRALAKRSGGQRMSWYRLRIGGELPQYVLMRSARTFSGGGSLPEVVLPPGLVRSVRSELLRFEPKLSYVP